MRKLIVTGEYYHVFNRGVDKRLITEDKEDSDRFLADLCQFNDEEPVGSILEMSRKKYYERYIGKRTKNNKLVELIAYCLNPNHYHLLLKQKVDGGLSEFMKRLNGGYTRFFNSKYGRSGALFQGKYKYKQVVDNDHLLHLSGYININDKVHKIGKGNQNLIRSSWDEYMSIDVAGGGLCNKKIILNQFRDIGGYKLFVNESLELMLEKKGEDKEIELLK